jgi:hypothetical protein
MPSSKPTVERQRHADGVTPPDVNGAAFRPWWRVETRFDALYRDGLIDEAERIAGEQLRRDWQHAAGSTASPLARAGQSATGTATPGAADAYALTRLAAAGRLRHVQARVGAPAFALLALVLVEDASWPTVGRALGCSHKTAKQHAVVALKRLAANRPPSRAAP